MKMRRLIGVLLLLPLSLWADTKETLDFLFSVKQVKETAISPDGQRVGWVEAQINKDRTESSNSFIYVRDPRAQTPRRVTAGKGDPLIEKSLAWSPDSTRLAFLSGNQKEKQLQLWLVPAAGGAPQKSTELKGHLANPRWSPDGKTIALLVIADVTRESGPLAAAKHDTGEVEEVVAEQRVVLVDVGSGKTRAITPPDTYVYEYDWSPDGRDIAYTAAKGVGDNNWWIAKLYTMDVDSLVLREVYKPETQIAVPRWSPDGKTIAFVQGLMSDEGSTGGDIWTVSSKGGEARNLTQGRKSSAAWIKWQPDQKHLLFTERVRGGSAVSTIDVNSGESLPLWTGDESLVAGDEDLSLSVAADGTTSALVRSSWDRAPEVWAGKIGTWKSQTALNTDLKPHWGKAEKIEWKNDGYAVQGWLLYPLNFDPQKKYPMVVSIHGGPASQKSPSWPRAAFDLSALSAEGYFVFFPNPRGSYGQGETFTAANVKDFGYGDLRDIMSGVDQVLKTVSVDEKRLGVGGWSYGGFMTMWTVTQTGRFRAAVAGAGLSNWQSYYGQNLIDQWMVPYFGASVYDDPAMYAKSSPINFIKNVKTPTLIVVGNSDAECPAPQSYEFWHALKTLGVKTKFVVYENEGHRFSNPAHVDDLLSRTVAWFNENLK